MTKTCIHLYGVMVCLGQQLFSTHKSKLTDDLTTTNLAIPLSFGLNLMIVRLPFKRQDIFNRDNRSRQLKLKTSDTTSAADHQHRFSQPPIKTPSSPESNVSRNELRTVGKRRRLVVKGQPRNKITDLAGTAKLHIF